MLWLFVRPAGLYLLDFFCSGIKFLLLSPYPCFISLFYLDLYVVGDKLGVFHANQISMCLDPHLN